MVEANWIFLFNRILGAIGSDAARIFRRPFGDTFQPNISNATCLMKPDFGTARRENGTVNVSHRFAGPGGEGAPSDHPLPWGVHPMYRAMQMSDSWVEFRQMVGRSVTLKDPVQAGQANMKQITIRWSQRSVAALRKHLDRPGVRLCAKHQPRQVGNKSWPGNSKRFQAAKALRLVRWTPPRSLGSNCAALD